MPVPGPSVLGRGVVVRAGGHGARRLGRRARGAHRRRGAGRSGHRGRPACTRPGWPASPWSWSSASTPRSFRAPATWDERALAARAVVRAVAGPAALPRLGQHLRRPRRADPVWWWGRKAERLGARRLTPEQRAGRRRAARRSAGLGRRRATDVLRAARRRGRRARRLGRAGPAHASSRSRWRPIADLAPDQLAAVAHGTGPARVIAPAGSGKTRVLTERLRHLSSTAASSGSACWRWPTTSGPSRRWRPARPDVPAAGADAQRARVRPPGRGPRARAPRCWTSARCAGWSRSWCPAQRRRAQHRSASAPTSRRCRSSASACATRRRSRPSATTSPAWPPPSTLPRAAGRSRNRRLRRADLRRRRPPPARR